MKIVSFVPCCGLAVLGFMGLQAQAQQVRRAAQPARPDQRISIEPTIRSWSEMLQLQSSLQVQAWTGDPVSEPMLALEPPLIDLPVPRALGVRPETSGGQESLMGGCTGFAVQPSLGAGFVAQDDVADGNGVMYIPPNVAGAVGPDHLMTMMNNAVQIRDRLGVSVTSVDPWVFWGVPAPAPLTAHSLAFPRINYDALHSRWIATARHGATAAVQVLLLGVSATDDPTGAWFFYAIDADAADLQSPDFVAHGHNGDWITMTANMFTGATFNGVKMWVAHQSTVGGALTVSVFATGFMATAHPGAAGSSCMPTRALDASLANMYLLNTGFTAGGVFLIQITEISNNAGSPAALGLAGSPFGGTTAFCYTTTNWSGTQRTMSQVGDARFITPFSIRQASAAVRNGSIWAANSGGLPGPSTNGAPTSNGLIWREIDPSLPFPATPGAGGSMLVQDGAVTDGIDTMAMYPSIAVNCADDVLMGFARGDVTKNPEAAYVMRLGTDPLSTMGPTTLLKAGDSSYWKNFGVGTTAQYGLYSSTAVDPNDDTTLWTLQQYAALRVGGADNDSRWGTWWGRLGDCEIRPVITDDPDDFVGCINDPVSFSVVATTGSNPLTYQWRKDGFDILGANADTYSIGSVVSADQGTYDCVVQGCGEEISAPASLVLLGATVTTDPVDFQADTGDPASFFVAGSGTGTLTYQWLADGNPISGETTDTYTIASVTVPDYSTLFSCTITDDCGPDTSDTARVRPAVRANNHELAELSFHIFQHPGDVTACVGSEVVLETIAYPEGVTYEWYKDDVAISPAETNSALVIDPLDAGDAGSYKCVVTFGARTRTSTTAVLTTNDVPVILVEPAPASRTANAGADITYTVTATGDGELFYQWKHKPTIPFAPFEDIDGANEPSLFLENVTAADSGSYKCVITNHCGGVQSRVVRLTIL